MFLKINRSVKRPRHSRPSMPKYESCSPLVMGSCDGDKHVGNVTIRGKIWVTVEKGTRNSQIKMNSSLKLCACQTVPSLTSSSRNTIFLASRTWACRMSAVAISSPPTLPCLTKKTEVIWINVSFTRKSQKGKGEGFNGFQKPRSLLLYEVLLTGNNIDLFTNLSLHSQQSIANCFTNVNNNNNNNNKK